eukprot:gb/GECH01004210.1/.p1 GENE.gb/GECH01004210.1/~~gb/GECH01004210.1/.p1  ORF type:complete len:1518 (+),score=360.33 gb/GECH01004210.1/:1-4554(+)
MGNKNSSIPFNSTSNQEDIQIPSTLRRNTQRNFSDEDDDSSQTLNQGSQSPISNTEDELSSCYDNRSSPPYSPRPISIGSPRPRSKKGKTDKKPKPKKKKFDNLSTLRMSQNVSANIFDTESRNTTNNHFINDKNTTNTRKHLRKSLSFDAKPINFINEDSSHAKAKNSPQKKKKAGPCPRSRGTTVLKFIQKSQAQKEEAKLLLLGVQGSGKSTVFRQIHKAFADSDNSINQGNNNNNNKKDENDNHNINENQINDISDDELIDLFEEPVTNAQSLLGKPTPELNSPLYDNYKQPNQFSIASEDRFKTDSKNTFSENINQQHGKQQNNVHSQSEKISYPSLTSSQESIYPLQSKSKNVKHSFKSDTLYPQLMEWPSSDEEDENDNDHRVLSPSVSPNLDNIDQENKKESEEKETQDQYQFFNTNSSHSTYSTQFLQNDIQQKENNQQNNEESKNTKISNENQTEDSYEEQDIPQLMVSGPEEMGDEKENHTQDNEEEKDQIESEHKPQQNRNKPIPNLTVGVDSPMSLSFGRQFQQFDGLTRSPISSSRLKSFDTPSSTPRKLNFGEESAKNQIRKETEDIETASSSSESSDEGDKSEHNNTEKETLENEFDQVQYPSEDEEAEDDSSIDSGYTAEDVGSRSYAEMIYDNDQFHKIRKLIDPDERILNIYNCLRVTGLDANTSIFVMCRKAVYVISNYQLRENTLVEVSDSSYGAWDIQQRTTSHTSKNSLGTQSSSSPSNSSPKNSGDGVDQKEEQTEEVQQHKIQKILYEDITELHKRRYLLRPVALELFCSNGKNVFLVFYIDEREEAYRQLIRDMPTKHLFGSRITGGGKEGYSSLKSWRKAMTSRWQKGEVSNFEYLMFINTIAGRSYNDLTQYPVFPWVLADYSSEELDLSDPNSFRDLSKPMGALGKRRREEFLERFESWEDPLSNVPAFHYGTHYSSAAIVLYYLIRLEPFTKQSMQLQGGRFDHADRLFFSMEETWRSAAEQNMSDVKELIPEFYYLPEFLENSNRLSMGVKQTGQAVDDVVLPPWAHGDPHIFIRKHRQALESPYVSENLHHWIDLIFGYKQKGQAAIDAMNVFYYLTYEGAVDIDEIENQMEREAVITQINNFGQTPHQVFKHQHPQRNVSTPSPLPTIYTFPEKLVSEPSRPNNTKNVSLRGVYQLRFKSDHAMALGQHSVFVEPSGHKYLQWGYPDNTLRLFQTSNHQLLSVYENTHESNITEAAVAPTGKELVIGGQDGTLSVWNLNKTPRSRSLTLRKRLFVHLRAITCIIISAAHSIIVSSSEDGLCVIWDLNSLQYVRQLQHQSIGPVSCSAVNAHSGDIVTAAGSAFFIWNINGTLLASHDTHKGSITALNLTAGPEWLNSTTIVTGHSDGAVKCWYFQPVQPHGDRISLRKEYTEHIQAVRSIAIHPNQKRMVTGDDSSTVLLRHLPFEGTQSHWIRDDEVDKCMQCESPFNQLRRRHHCRSCGRVVCGSCSSQKTELPVYNFFRPVRVCSDCYELASALRSQGTMY